MRVSVKKTYKEALNYFLHGSPISSNNEIYVHYLNNLKYFNTAAEKEAYKHQEVVSLVAALQYDQMYGFGKELLEPSWTTGD